MSYRKKNTNISIQLESIPEVQKNSFRVLENPDLRDVFYWHHHPEYELVYIHKVNGNRMVGEYIRPFKNGDLMLIGSDIPHLNFDYGMAEACEMIVVHIKMQFKTQICAFCPELSEVFTLLDQSQHALVFPSLAKDHLGPKMLDLPKQDSFDQFLNIISILKSLSEYKEVEKMHKKPYPLLADSARNDRLNLIYQFVESHYQQKFSMEVLARHLSMAPGSVSRYFKSQTGQSFIHFLNQFRINQAKKMLIIGKSVSEVAYETGHESLSYFNRNFKKYEHCNPSEFVRKSLYNKNFYKQRR